MDEIGKEGFEIVELLMRMNRIKYGVERIKETLEDYGEVDVKTMITVAIFDYCNEHDIPFLDFISEMAMASINAIDAMEGDM